MTDRTPIAVVGIGGVFPGAPDIDAFWHNIVHRVESIREVPENRWSVPPNKVASPHPAPDRALSMRAGLVDQFAPDPAAWGLDPLLAANLDPLYHLVLKAGHAAFSDCASNAVDRSRTGVILAAIALPTDASSRIAQDILGRDIAERCMRETLGERAVPPFRKLDRSQCLAARVTSLPGALLARSLGLGGGSYTLDAACASSIYAVKLACDALQSDRMDTVLAGGVSRPDALYTQIGFSQLRALSPSGRCAPFDAGADGLVVGEGAGVLVLKRLEDALAHGDTITAVIRGIGLSNDMRGNLLAPDTEGQVRAMRAAYAAAGWSPSDVDHIECHGAGTPLGDRTELTSLRTLWKGAKWSRGMCAIGSIKSMIGHLLTAAGAAGMIKTLMAMKHHTLPPSLNFTRAAEDSPLRGGPFRVQIEAEPWEARDEHPLRRAAVSAFGFGGINGHLLFEEFHPDPHPPKQTGSTKVTDAPAASGEKVPPPEIAIVGMAAHIGPLASLRAFQEAVFNGAPAFCRRPESRFKGTDDLAERHLNGQGAYGAYLESFAVDVGEFRIPPNEIPDILTQQLLMLKTAAAAMADARMALGGDLPRAGAAIGMEFDLEDTDFHPRWQLIHQSDQLKKFLKENFPEIDDALAAQWMEDLQDALSRPLTASRVLGSLGGIVASRAAREFRFGGPSHVVSCGAASGLRALEIGVRSLQQMETDTFLAGAVDLTGDVRNMVIESGIRPFGTGDRVRPFDREADGTLPGEGAVALILKRRDQAVADGDRIYAVIKGFGSASGGGIDDLAALKTAYAGALKRALGDAGTPAAAVGFLETHGSGDLREDRLEAEALHEVFAEVSSRPAIGSLKAVTGDTGASAGLASVVKTALCLYHELLPPLPGFTEPEHENWRQERFHIPIRPQFWIRDRKDGPRRALVSAVTGDGNAVHAVLEGNDAAVPEAVSERIFRERRRPTGLECAGLFVVEGETRDVLLDGLDRLHRHSRQDAPTMEAIAMGWYREHRPAFPMLPRAVAIVAKDPDALRHWIEEGRRAVHSSTPRKIIGPGGVSYFPEPLGPVGRIAFVYPGSGNHYVGMGRGIGVRWPEILRGMDRETQALKTQMFPECYMPFRVSWEEGWEDAAYRKIVSDPHHMIFGQVVHGGMMTSLANYFGVRPQAVIGYSLGESAGLFATGAWPERGEMLARMQKTALFKTDLAGPCNAARKAWHLSETDLPVDWRVAVVNRKASDVREVLVRWPLARLLIVNTPSECVIGGNGGHVAGVIRALGCDAIYLEGVVTVHCDAALPVAEAYRELHRFPTTAPPDIRYYSCTLGRAQALTEASAADSILGQALHGFDFPTTVEQAYADGVRLFLEMGPQASCKRMIDRILEGKPHSALSASVRGEDEYLTILKFLGTLAAERVPVNLDNLYGKAAYPEPAEKNLTPGRKVHRTVNRIIGGDSPKPAPPVANSKNILAPPEKSAGPTTDTPLRTADTGPETPTMAIDRVPLRTPTSETTTPAPTPPLSEVAFPKDSGPEPIETNASPVMTETPVGDAAPQPFAQFLASVNENIFATADAHRAFLDFSEALTRNYGRSFVIQNRLLEKMTTLTGGQPAVSAMPDAEPLTKAGSTPPPAYSREMCMEFAVGSAARVLGPEFAEVDTYPVRVRLPDTPLMLVDRILSVEGEKGGMGSGRVITEHDVLPDAWYLDGGRAPTCISVEAGQADLFLSGYLGIDLKVKGTRAYRLLDAKATFHRGLPRPGDVIRYDIHIDKFVRQGETYMFFFRFEGYIGDEHLITMRDGCAGFFTEAEVRDSGGIIRRQEDTTPLPGRSDFTELVPMVSEGYDERAVDALRQGDLAACFGRHFAGVTAPVSLRLPGGLMRLVHRVVSLDPGGGRYGLGIIRAEADIHPDDWFLTCHFTDDMVMPGTLMYECCMHTLRIFLQRMGWVSENPGDCYEPVSGRESILKCRGPVTPATQKVVYEVEIAEIGYGPEPYATADAMMVADGRPIVRFENMSMKLSGSGRRELESFWAGRRPAAPLPVSDPVVFSRNQLMAFCSGNPSEAFGEPYRIFDRERKLARLPRPPYLFMDRVIRSAHEPWVLKPGGWIEADYAFTPDEWYFNADRNGVMPFCILLEIALQPCGWLAAYMGSALKSDQDLKFRNLGGKAVIHRNVPRKAGRLTMRTRLTQSSTAGGMIIEHFDMAVASGGEPVYTGSTYFGFFTKAALAQQVGIQGAGTVSYQPTLEEVSCGETHGFSDDRPLSPDDPETDTTPALALPAKALRMIDTIELWAPEGGPHGLGFVRGAKTVDPNEWFFQAHFYQDPVCPGSLGVESFVQLIKFAALKRWKHLLWTHRFEMLTGEAHQWSYRGQIVQANQRIEVDAVITRVTEGEAPTIRADGFLKVDGLYIYQMENFGLQLVPIR